MIPGYLLTTTGYIFTYGQTKLVKQEFTLQKQSENNYRRLDVI